MLNSMVSIQILTKVYRAWLKEGTYYKIKQYSQYGISQLLIVRSGLHLVTYLNVGNFCDKRAEKTLHAICVQGFLGFSDSNMPSQSVSLIYELA